MKPQGQVDAYGNGDEANLREKDKKVRMISQKMAASKKERSIEDSLEISIRR
jgi:hypothetical protein